MPALVIVSSNKGGGCRVYRPNGVGRKIVVSNPHTAAHQKLSQRIKNCGVLNSLGKTSQTRYKRIEVSSWRDCDDHSRLHCLGRSNHPNPVGRGTGVSGNQALLIRRFQISKYCSTQIGDVEEPDNHEHAEDYYADFDFVWLFPANHSLNVKPLLSDSNCPMV